MIFPESLPQNFPRGSSEDYYFTRFRDELDDSWQVYYSLKLVTPDVPLREIDFVLVHARGILCLELKNSLLRIHSGIWQFHNREGQWEELHKYSSPLAQAESASKRLLQFLQNHTLDHEPLRQQSISYVCLFLKQSRIDLPLPNDESLHAVFHDELPAAHSGRESGLENFFLRLYDRLGVLASGTGTQAQINRTIQLNLNYAVSVKKKKSVQHSEMISLTAQQYSVLRALEQEGRLLLSGTAGSGKTVIAVEAARRLSRQGKKILFLCFNRNLNEYLKKSLEAYPGVDIFTAPTLYRNIITEFDPQRLKKKERQPDALSEEQKAKMKEQREEQKKERQFEREVLAGMALGYAEEYAAAMQKPYDVLILDEGQDIMLEEPMLLLDSLVRNGLSDGQWLIAYDADQSLFSEMEAGLSYIRKNSHSYFELKENIRTPKRIFAFASRFAGVEGTQARLADITDLRLVYYKNAMEGREHLLRILDYAIRELKFQPEEITILTDERSRSAHELFDRRAVLGSYKLLNYEKDNSKAGFVNYCQVARYKGLENRFIVLVADFDISTEEGRRKIFIGLSRAISAAALLVPTRNRQALEEAAGERMR